MKRNLCLGIVLGAIGLIASPATAGIIDASAALTAKPDGADWDYTIILKNSSASTEGIGSLWFGGSPIRIIRICFPPAHFRSHRPSDGLNRLRI